MFSSIPPRQRFLLQAALASVWVLVALGAVVQAAIAPRGWLYDISGLGEAAMCAVAALGVALDRYQLEWVAAWLASALTVPTIVILAVNSLGDPDQYLAGTLRNGALLAFFSYRALVCAAYSAKLRAQLESREEGDE